MSDTKPCSACRQSIDALATRCPHCRGRQADAPAMHRGQPNKLIAGVCAAIADHLGVDVAWVRVAFGVGALVSGGLMLWVYGLMWVATPAAPGARPPLSRFVDWVQDLFGGSRQSPQPPVTPSV